MSFLAQKDPSPSPSDPRLVEAFAAAFEKELARSERESGLPVAEWFWAGNTKPETSVDNWFQLGPRAVQNFIDWYERSPYKIWTTPDGQPAIELKVETNFGRTPVLAYIDAVLVSPDGSLLVLDSKSGANIPDSAQQVAFYASCIELKYGRRPEHGAYFMARGAGRNKDIFLTEIQDLSLPQYSADFFRAELFSMAAGVGAEAFVARVGKHCNTCNVARSCAAVGGPDSQKVDPAHPLFIPF